MSIFRPYERTSVYDFNVFGTGIWMSCSAAVHLQCICSAGYMDVLQSASCRTLCRLHGCPAVPSRCPAKCYSSPPNLSSIQRFRWLHRHSGSELRRSRTDVNSRSWFMVLSFGRNPGREKDTTGSPGAACVNSATCTSTVISRELGTSLASLA